MCYEFVHVFLNAILEDETIPNGNPTISLANAMEIPRLELVQNPCNVSV